MASAGTRPRSSIRGGGGGQVSAVVEDRGAGEVGDGVRAVRNGRWVWVGSVYIGGLAECANEYALVNCLELLQVSPAPLSIFSCFFLFLFPFCLRSA